MERWKIAAGRGWMIVLLIGFLFGVVTLSVILVLRHLMFGNYASVFENCGKRIAS